jgi:hypothetical protein
MTYGKLPPVERGYDGGGLTGPCAYMWALFLRNEADMASDIVLFDKWTVLCEQLAPRQGVPQPSSVHCADLEDAIKQYTTTKTKGEVE